MKVDNIYNEFSLTKKSRLMNILFVIIINVYLDFNNVVIKWKASSSRKNN